MTEVKIIKRNGDKVPYDLEKIERAVGLALGETDESVSWDGYEDFLNVVEQQIEDETTVEEIQDIIEIELMKQGLYKTAKRYILYREKRDEARKNIKQEKFGILSKEFLSKYKHAPDPFPTIMSHFTYLRTYSRYLPEENRRERWWETVKRVVEYNCNLAPTTTEEAEKIYDNIFNLRQFTSGRSLWVANTEVSKKYPMSNYNCAFKIIDTFDTFHEGFYLLLIGAGMGFRVFSEDVSKLPKVRNNIKINHKYYIGIPKHNRKEFTEFTVEDNSAIITIGDSKESWVKSLQLFLEIHYNPMYRDISSIEIIYDHIRPKGERLKTFGGYASGYESMQIMFSKIENVIRNSKNKFNEYTKLSPIDCVDIANILGENVVSGGVRRTAEIILFDESDQEMIDAKSNLYKLEDGKWIVNQDIIHRQMSNNSIFYNKKPSREQLKWQIEKMRYSGEPAFVNREAGNKRRENFNGVNACSEILLDSSGMCNLTEIVPIRFVENGILNEDTLYDAQRLSARIGYRMTLVDFELPAWDYINKRDRLIGCSVTGWQDFVNLLNLSKEEQIRILNNLRDVAKEEAKKIANELGLNEPVLNLTCKPSGTISLLPAVSSGVHFSHSEYYIRRIRINAHDPLAEAMKEMGFDWKPEVGQSKDSPTTIIFEFPMQAPSGKTKYDVSALEQLEIYKMFMNEYADHNVSITVHVRSHEWDAVEEWLWNNWDDAVALSFLALDDNFYELLPYESIGRSKYDEMISNLPKFNPDLLQKFEKGEDLEIDDSSCEGGICPIR